MFADIAGQEAPASFPTDVPDTCALTRRQEHGWEMDVADIVGRAVPASHHVDWKDKHNLTFSPTG